MVNCLLAIAAPFAPTLSVKHSKPKIPKYPEFKDNDLFPLGFMDEGSTARQVFGMPGVEPLVLALIQRVLRIALPQRFMWDYGAFEEWRKANNRLGENPFAEIVFEESKCPNCRQPATSQKKRKKPIQKVKIQPRPSRSRSSTRN